MGLDMYLTQKFYVKNWDHMQDDEKHSISILKGGLPSSIPTERISYVETEEIYWRKANAIHRWFVDNVQEGKDECQDSYVSMEDLKDLLADITKVLDSVINGWSVAEQILPTGSGFFFGNTDYDQWYYEELERTKRELERILQCQVNGDFYYHASW